MREAAEALRLPVATDLAAVPAFAPDLLAWAAYGRRIPPELLRIRWGGLNVHPSLLPRWRGPAPVQAALLAGDRETGVSLMRATPEIDAGDVLAERPTLVSPYEDALSLSARLGELGAALLEDALPRYLAGALEPRPQDERQVTWSHRLGVAECVLDFRRAARELWRVVRAAAAGPVARTTWRGAPLLVWKAGVSDEAKPADPGRVRPCGEDVCVDTAEDLLVLEVVQPAGKRKMSGPEWARGARLGESSRLPC